MIMFHCVPGITLRRAWKNHFYVETEHHRLRIKRGELERVFSLMVRLFFIVRGDGCLRINDEEFGRAFGYDPTGESWYVEVYPRERLSRQLGHTPWQHQTHKEPVLLVGRRSELPGIELLAKRFLENGELLDAFSDNL